MILHFLSCHCKIRGRKFNTSFILDRFLRNVLFCSELNFLILQSTSHSHYIEPQQRHGRSDNHIWDRKKEAQLQNKMPLRQQANPSSERLVQVISSSFPMNTLFFHLFLSFSTSISWHATSTNLSFCLSF